MAVSVPALGSSAAADYGRIGGLVFGADGGAVCFQERALYVHCRSTCLPLTAPNTRNPHDSCQQQPAAAEEQVLHLLTNYPDEYVPLELLCGELKEATPPSPATAPTAAPVCLPNLRYPAHPLLLYPSGANLECLALAELLPRSDEEAAPGIASSFAAFAQSHAPLRISLLETHRLPGRLRQIDAVRCQNKMCVVVCSEYLLALFEEVCGDHAHLECCRVWSSDVPITAVSLNPFIPGDVIVSLQSRSVYLLSQGKTVKLSLGTAELLQLCHSNHPRRLVVAEARSLALVEYLSEGVSLRPLLSSPCTVLPDHVTITCLSHDRDHTHCVLVATSEQFLVLDLRQPLPPVLAARHTLTHPPSAITTLTPHTGGQTLVLLSSQSECVLFCCVYSEGSVPHFTAPPFSFNQPQDFAGIMSVECAVVYTVCARLSCELAGACLVSLREGGGAPLAVLQMTTLGDVFYQLCSLERSPPPPTPLSVLPGYRLWLEEAWQQEKDLAQYADAEASNQTGVLDLHSLVHYVLSPCSLLCPHCLAFARQHAIKLPTSSHAPPPSHARPPYQCVFCGSTLHPPPLTVKPKLLKTNLHPLPSSPITANPLTTGCIDVTPRSSFDEQLMRGWEDAGRTVEATPTSGIAATPPRSPEVKRRKIATPKSKLRHRIGF